MGRSLDGLEIVALMWCREGSLQQISHGIYFQE